MPITYSYVNGKILESKKAKIPLFDRGLFLGDGLFETLKAKNGKPIFWKDHYQRLSLSAKQIFISNLPTANQIENIIKQLCVKSQSLLSIVRIIVTRGAYDFSLNISNKQKCHLFITIKDLPIRRRISNHININTTLQKDFSSLSNLKTLNYLPNILHKQKSIQQNFDDTLLIDTNQNILELTSSNFFCIINNTLTTPTLNNSILPGITRSQILEMAKSLNWKVCERNININEIENFQEAFSTSSILGVIVISKINQTKIQHYSTNFKKTWFNKILAYFNDWEEKVL